MSQQSSYKTTTEIRILMWMVARLSMRSLEDQITAANLGINGLQYGILRMLCNHSFTLSELSRKFILDPSTLVPVVDDLERKGFLLRGKDPQDRRRVPLSTTDDGKALLNSIPFSHEDDMLYQCMNQLGDEKAQTLLALLRELVRQIPEGEDMLQEVAIRIHAYNSDHPAGSSGDSTP